MNINRVAVAAALAFLALVAGVVLYALSTNAKIKDLQSTQTLLQRELTTTRQELGSTRGELASTQEDLLSTKEEFTSTREELAATRGELASTQEDLALTKSDLTSTQGDLASTKMELSSTRQDLTTTKEDLSTASSSLEQTRRDLTSTQQNLSTTQASLESTRSNLSSTRGDLTETQRDLETTKRDLSSTQGDLASTREDLSATQEDLSSTQSSLASTRSLLTSTSRELASTRADLSETNTTLSTVRTDLDMIMETYGNIDTLNDRVSSLERDIEELEERRKPLILETRRNWFACTGSMEPKITCLDEATWLVNPRPEDIVVGSTISFSPTEECVISGERIAHRVTAVKEADGTYYYWPKGDNNRRADGCWIPDDKVNGYIIEMHKDVFADTSTSELRDRYNKARKEYDDFCRRNTVTPGRCVLYESNFYRARALGDKIDCWREIVDEWNYPEGQGNELNSLLLSRGIEECG